MAQLSAQSIRKLCVNEPFMISPFVGAKTVVNGKSYGLSSASYDVRIAHDLTLGPNPAYVLSDMLRANRHYTADAVLQLWRAQVHNSHPTHALAYTMEDFNLPGNVSGLVTDKSTYARQFLSAMNTFIDPGFKGNLTLELVNLGSDYVSLQAGDPVAQILFFELDEQTERPYAGKYQHQTKGAHGARYD